MTGDGGEYLRAEDLRELGDDSLPGHYLDFSYMNNMNIDRYKNTSTQGGGLSPSAPSAPSAPSHKHRHQRGGWLCCRSQHTPLHQSFHQRDGFFIEDVLTSHQVSGAVAFLPALSLMSSDLRGRFFVVLFFCRCQFCPKSTKRTPSV